MSATAAPSLERKRVNFVLSEKAYTELAALSRRTGRSMTELVRLGLALAKIAIEAELEGRKLIVTTTDGNPLKEIVLPG